MSLKNKVSEILESIEVSNNFRWQYKSNTSNEFKQFVSTVTNTPEGEIPDCFAKRAILEVLRTASKEGRAGARCAEPCF